MQPLSCDLWLMEKNAMRQFVDLAKLQIRTDPEMIRTHTEPRRQKTVAILPIHGVLEARPSFVGAFFGMSSYEAIGQKFESLMADESVRGIVLDVMSPGGMVYGCQELADQIFKSRGKKPILAVANPMAASGAYWLAAAADRLVVTPSGDVGSVGVIWEHVDFSQAHEREGVNVTVIRSSDAPHKAETSTLEPLSEEARENMQARADAIHAQFVGDLARFRGVSVDRVNQHFGQGRIVDSKQAMSAGMVDRVDTLQNVAVKLAAGRIRIASERSKDDWDSPSDWEIDRVKRLERAEQIRAQAE